jgi:hypothetical protein
MSTFFSLVLCLSCWLVHASVKSQITQSFPCYRAFVKRHPQYRSFKDCTPGELTLFEQEEKLRPTPQKYSQALRVSDLRRIVESIKTHGENVMCPHLGEILLNVHSSIRLKEFFSSTCMNLAFGGKVNQTNLNILLPFIEKDLSVASFVAVDAEFTGIDVRISKFSLLEQRYQSIRKCMETNRMLQFGLAIYWLSGRKISSNVWTFYIKVDLEDVNRMGDNVRQALGNFDYDSCIHLGIDFAPVFELLSRYKPAVVLYNGTWDLAYMVRGAFGELPVEYHDFVMEIYSAVPRVLDLKYVLHQKDIQDMLLEEPIPRFNCSLESVYQSIPRPAIPLSTSFQGDFAHDAGYDAMMTGEIFRTVFERVGIIEHLFGCINLGGNSIFPYWGLGSADPPSEAKAIFELVGFHSTDKTAHKNSTRIKQLCYQATGLIVHIDRHPENPEQWLVELDTPLNASLFNNFGKRFNLSTGNDVTIEYK